MFYHLANSLKYYSSFFNVVHYVSFRVVAALLTALLLSFLFGQLFINFASAYFRSPRRPWLPHTHQRKHDMPTMGGIFVVLIVLVTSLLWCNLYRLQVWFLVATLVSFACIGFFDDWQKLSYPLGMRSSTKFALQIFVSIIIICAWLYWSKISTQVYVPFFKYVHPDLGWWFLIWAVFVLVGTSNAVNLTDGLDGLAIGSLIPTFGTMSLLCYLAGHQLITQYLFIPFANSAELSIVGAALFGSSLGFLWYNTYPAQLFMGDVGSLALGAALGFMALACKQEMLLVIAGGLFVAETISVIVQVVSFRLFGKRWFKMAPMHHHFELLGWPEAKITVRFAIVSFILCLVALMTLKLR